MFSTYTHKYTHARKQNVRHLDVSLPPPCPKLGLTESIVHAATDQAIIHNGTIVT